MTIQSPIHVSMAVALGALALGLTAVTGATAAPAPNPARGGQLFLQCKACHTVAAGAPHSNGPNLAGVFGAKAGTRPGYKYSAALTKSGKVWNQANLNAYLKRPSQAVPGTKMAFGGVANDQARADLIAYVATLKGKK